MDDDALAEQVCCWLWTFYGPQPDWLYSIRGDEWSPIFINKTVDSNFRKLCAVNGWSRFTWKSVVESCGRYPIDRRIELASQVEHLMLAKDDIALSLRKGDNSTIDRLISFED